MSLIKTIFKLLPLFLLLTFNTSAQNKVTTVSFKYKKEPSLLESYWFEVYKPLLNNAFGEASIFPKKFISHTVVGDSCETKYEYNIPEITCASLADIFGHEIIVIPGDRIVVHIGEPNKTRIAGVSGVFVRQWLHDLSYSGTHKYTYSLFDSLTNFDGDLRNGSDIRFKKTDLTLDSFCHAVKAHYLNRLQYVDRYSKTHVLPLQVQKLVKSEIYTSYLNNLIIPLYGWGKSISDYPSIYAELIRNIKFDNEELYFKTTLYSSLATTFNVLNINKPVVVPTYSPQELVTKYNWLKNNYKSKIRDHQITAYLERPVGKGGIARTMDSLLLDFKSFAQNKNYILHLERIYSSIEVKKEPVYTLNQAMESEIVDRSGTKKSISSLLNKKPVVFICWASWCKPCIEEVPYEKTLEEEFGSKIDFIYLSFDFAKSEWIAKSKELNIDHNSYFLTNNVKSDLASHYKINSIPRYLIYDKDGKKIDEQKLRPSDKNFKSILEGIIK